MMGWGYGAGMGLWGWMMMGGFWLLLLAVAVGAVAWIFPRDRRWVATRENRPRPAGYGGYPPATAAATRPAGPPLSILNDRLARGEIDVETYRALRAEFGSPAARPTDASHPARAGADRPR